MKNLKKLVQIPSNQNGDNIIKFICDELKDKVEEIKIVKNKENNDSSLLVGINTKLKDTKPIVLSGHLDTVDADFDKYDTNPFTLVEKDGKAYGLGSIDMKCFMASVLDLLNELKKLSSPIVLAFTTDEETRLKCVENVAREFQKLNICPKFTIIGEPTSMEIKTTSNGCYEYEVKVFGKSCHSSAIANGINAVCIISKLITYIEAEQKSFNITSNVGVIYGGDVVNRVPDQATIRFDIRTTNNNEAENFIDKIKEKIVSLKQEYIGSNIILQKLLEIPPLQNLDSQLVSSLARKLSLNTGKFNGGCEAGYFQKLGSKAIIFGVGDLNLAHKPNEYMVIEDYYKYNQILLNLIKLIEDEMF